MFISQACFKGAKLNEQKIITKLQKTMKETSNVEGLISTECWLNENKDRVEYVLVTKWENKEYFKKWVTREEHVEEHKEMHKQKQQVLQEEVQLKKTLCQYEMANISS
jgi:heme-degrading monooxygenase HmoA